MGDKSRGGRLSEAPNGAMIVMGVSRLDRFWFSQENKVRTMDRNKMAKMSLGGGIGNPPTIPEKDLNH